MEKGNLFSNRHVMFAHVSCILTIMAIAVEKNNICMNNTFAIVKKTWDITLEELLELMSK